MHISDGILSAPILTSGFVGTGVISVITMKKMDMEEIPKISVITSVFFVASLIHIPLGITSVHLILNGLAGVILGIRAFPAIMVGVILQTILFGHGGVTVIGVNTLMLGGGGLIAYFIWQQRHYLRYEKKEALFGALAGAAGIVGSGVILALALAATGKEFLATAGYALTAHVPIMIIEGIVVGGCANFIKKVNPGLLAGQVTKKE